MVETRPGRPRKFVESDVLDRAVDVFWAHGFTATTTRVLEAELGLRQSSIYNAFGSKEALLHRSLDQYLTRVESQLLGPVLESDASPDQVVQFIDDLLAWISDAAHPGCLMLKVAAELRHDDTVADRAAAYRARVRQALQHAMHNSAAAEVVLAGVLGLNLAAAGGASATELTDMATALKQYVAQAQPNPA